MKVLLSVLLFYFQVPTVSTETQTPQGDVVAGRPYTLECTINRTTGDENYVNLRLYTDNSRYPITAHTRECTRSIALRTFFQLPPFCVSVGCQPVNGEEVYIMRMGNIQQDMGRITWRCYYGSQNTVFTLPVQVMVSQVTLTDPPGTLTAGDPATFTCVTSASRPQACVRCYIRSSGNVRELDPADCNPDTSSVQTTTRTLTFTASAEENGAELYCDATNSVTDPPVRSQVYTLDVQFMVSQVTLRNPPGTLTAGDPATFTCVTSASRPQACVRCYIRSSGNVRELDPADCNPDTSSVQNTTRTLTFTASAEENGAELYCNASNSVTDPPVRSQVYTLDVQYSPEIHCNQTHVTAFEDQRVDVSCDVMARPKADIAWRKGGDESGEGSNIVNQTDRDVTISGLEISKAETRHSGVYEIAATNAVGASRAEVIITVIGSCLSKEELVDPTPGLSNGSALGLGVVLGIVIATLTGFAVICWHLRRGRLTWRKAKMEEADDRNGGTDRGMESGRQSTGHYETLDVGLNLTSRTCGNYENVSVQRPSPVSTQERIYENTTVCN